MYSTVCEIYVSIHAMDQLVRYSSMSSLLTALSETLKHFHCHLTEFELEEIMDYSEIWYLGLDTNKIEASRRTPHNSGYDDEHGSYIKVRLYIFFTLAISVPY